jgi:CTP synthase
MFLFALVCATGLGGEQKSKPTQHGVRELRAAGLCSACLTLPRLRSWRLTLRFVALALCNASGLNPDLIACRSSKPLERSSIEKISHYSMISSDNVISVFDVSNIYRVSDWKQCSGGWSGRGGCYAYD